LIPINLLTLWLTSSFVVDSTRQATYRFGSVFAATTMAFAAFSRGMP